ncbi:MAG: hypothetical protein Q8P32_03880 [Candidatus Komeilibacteria bacterium]|nr:hypothetical protein [Candidatus Komeilibacteria bacterium]
MRRIKEIIGKTFVTDITSQPFPPPVPHQATAAVSSLITSNGQLLIKVVLTRDNEKEGLRKVYFG